MEVSEPRKERGDQGCPACPPKRLPIYRFSPAFPMLLGRWLADVRVGCFLAAFLIPAIAPADEPDGFSKILDLASEAEPKEALRHLTRVATGLAADKGLTQVDRHELTARLARVLADKAREPGDLEAVLGTRAVKQVARQVIFRRYLEQWSYEAPVRLCVTLEWPRGKDVVIRAIVALAESP